MKKISIIVPAYNVERYLRECIESICTQTHTNLEIIIVDDGSTDMTGSICDEYAEKDNRIIVIHQKNGGMSNARNSALDIATGDYIGYVDSDDVIHPRMFEFLLGALEKNDVDISYCGEVAFKDGERVGFDEYKDYSVWRIESRDELLGHCCDDWTGPTNWVWNKLYKRELFEKIRFVENRRMEDVMISAEILLNVKKAVWINERLYGYRQRTGSTMNSSDPRIPKEYAEAIMAQRKSIAVTGNLPLIRKYNEYALRKISKLRCDYIKCKDANDKKGLYIKKMIDEIYSTMDLANAGFKKKIKFFIMRYFFIIYKGICRYRKIC